MRQGFRAMEHVSHGEGTPVRPGGVHGFVHDGADSRGMRTSPNRHETDFTPKLRLDQRPCDNLEAKISQHQLEPATRPRYAHRGFFRFGSSLLRPTA